jgi:hypothetical protein
MNCYCIYIVNVGTICRNTFFKLSLTLYLTKQVLKTVQSNQRSDDAKIRTCLDAVLHLHFMSVRILHFLVLVLIFQKLWGYSYLRRHCPSHRRLLSQRRVSISGHYFRHCQVYSFSLRGYTILSCGVLKGKRKTHKMIWTLVRFDYFAVEGSWVMG